MKNANHIELVQPQSYQFNKIRYFYYRSALINTIDKVNGYIQEQ